MFNRHTAFGEKQVQSMSAVRLFSKDRVGHRNTFGPAALLLLVLLTALLLTACAGHKKSLPDESLKSATTEPEQTSAICPMVNIKGQIYCSTGYTDCAVGCGTPDGYIDRTVSPGEVPGQDGESNFGKGYTYQILNDGEVSVAIDDRQVVFRAAEAESDQMPAVVAHLTGVVEQVEEDRLMVRVIKVPELFDTVFDKKEPTACRVDWTNAVLYRNCQVGQTAAGHERLPSPKPLLGHTVELWFDGNSVEADPTTPGAFVISQTYRLEQLTD